MLENVRRSFVFENYQMEQPYRDIKPNKAVPQVVVLHMHHQYMKNYSYLVVDPGSRQAVIVDPAWEMEKIDQALREAQASLKGILITHSHRDHIHLAEATAEAYDCPIWMSKQAIAASGFRATRLIGIDATPWEVAHMLIEPIFTPGHSPGCMCYVIADNIFTGDVLFAEGCGICPDVEAAHTMYASLQKLKVRIKPQAHIYPGHSYHQPPGQVMWRLMKENIYLQFPDKHSFAAYRLRSGQDLSKMFRFQ
jgi:hydroxyacylglutathione hydrolase